MNRIWRYVDGMEAGGIGAALCGLAVVAFAVAMGEFVPALRWPQAALVCLLSAIFVLGAPFFVWKLFSGSDNPLSAMLRHPKYCVAACGIPFLVLFAMLSVIPRASDGPLAQLFFPDYGRTLYLYPGIAVSNTLALTVKGDAASA